MNRRSGCGYAWVAAAFVSAGWPGECARAAVALLVALAWPGHGRAQLREPDATGSSSPGVPSPVKPAAEAPSQRLVDALLLEPGATCLERDRLVRRVARWLQTDRVEATLKVEVRGDARDPRKIAFVIDRGAGGRRVRTIDDGPSDCDQLHAALALSIALAIDANLGLGGAPAPELPDDETLVASKPKPAYFKLGAALMLHATSGLLTDVSAGASARVEAGFLPWLDLRLGALGSTVDNQTIREVMPGRFSDGLIAGRADACAAHLLGELRVLACAGVMAGVFSARGEGFSGSQATDNRAWGGAVGGFELQAQLAHWLALAAAVDLVVPFATRRIQVVDAFNRPTQPRTLTSVAVLVGAGPVLRFF